MHTKGAWNPLGTKEGTHAAEVGREGDKNCGTHFCFYSGFPDSLNLCRRSLRSVRTDKPALHMRMGVGGELYCVGQVHCTKFVCSLIVKGCEGQTPNDDSSTCSLLFEQHSVHYFLLSFLGTNYTTNFYHFWDYINSLFLYLALLPFLFSFFIYQKKFP